MKKRKYRRKRSLGFIKLILTIIFIILLIYLIKLGVNTMSNKEDTTTNIKNNNKQEEINKKDEAEQEKYTKEEKEKLEKLDYVNEKISDTKVSDIFMLYGKFLEICHRERSLTATQRDGILLPIWSRR